ncbi:MAG: GNAT family N-acetyltransferase [Legionella sp.]|nr:MAG: GNAT family N-acetyltransferase [Legionella sp.]
MKLDIIQSSAEEIELIDNKLGDYNKTQVQYTAKMDFLPLNFHIKDEQGSIIAGINALSCWQMLHISELYVDEYHRGKAIGSLLLNKVETEAKAIGATISHTDTFDWQAEGFYLKHGYEVFGVIDDCPKGHKRFFLKKYL